MHSNHRITHPVKTVFAVALAFIIVVIASFVVPSIIYILCNLLRIPSNIPVSVIAVVAGAVVGVYAYRLICDKALKGYFCRAVFFVFIAIVIAAIAFELLFVPVRLEEIISYAQIAGVGGAAYIAFGRAGAEGTLS